VLGRRPGRAVGHRLLGLLAAPAGAAHRLTPRPYHALALSAGLAVAEVWTGLGLSYVIPKLPPSFAIVGMAAVVHGAAFAVRPGKRGERVRRRERTDRGRGRATGRWGAHTELVRSVSVRPWWKAEP
jgi:hypothetical protein